MDHEIRFLKQSPLHLTGYCDANWVGYIDTMSTFGFCTLP